MKKILPVFCAFALSLSLNAEVFMPKIFSDYMVLQRGEPVKLWGRAAAGAKVEASFAGQKKSAKAGADGKWEIFLDPMKESAENRTLTISENGTEGKKFENVLVGEVWLTGGQSNMQCTMGGSKDEPRTFEYAKTDNPNVRCFIQYDATSRTPLEDFKSKALWQEAKGNNILGFTAVGFVFACELNKSLNVPVGIISSAIGGSPMGVWINEDDMAKSDAFKNAVLGYRNSVAKYDYQKELAAWEKKMAELPEDASAGDKAALKGKKPDPEGPPVLISKGYNAKIVPMIGYTIKGVIWYQGEADCYRENPEVLGDKKFDKFTEKFVCLINSWRKDWNRPDLPFYFSQLASYQKNLPDECWAYTREAQMETSKHLKNVEGVCLVDSGDKMDIHPRDKIIPGTRLALRALKNVYGRSVVSYGPEVKSAKLKNGVLTLTLVSNDSKPVVAKIPPRAFEARIDGVWKPIEVSLKGNTITANVQGDVDALRYLWENHTMEDACIFNSSGLPLDLFRMPVEK